MLKLKKILKNNENGITLVSLVITIILLLILAGISLSTQFKKNGIINQSIQIKENMKIEEELKKVQLAYLTLSIQKLSDEVTPEKLQKELEKENNIKVSNKRDAEGKKGILVEFTKTDHYYFVENDIVRIATKEEFSNKVTPLYAILYSDGDLRFNTTGNIDETKTEAGCTVVLKSENISETELSPYTETRPYASNISDIKSVTIEEKIVLKYASTLFKDMTNLESINNIEKLFTENVTDMSYMFYGCSTLKELDLSTFETANVINMKHMFHNCKNLTELKIENFNTSNVQEMHYLFSNMFSITKLNLGNFQTTNVTKMDGMFQGCTVLEKIELSTFETSKVENMQGMFQGCNKLENIVFSEKFKTTNVTNMNSMFASCINLKELNLSKFDISKVNDIKGMFKGCGSITTLDLSSFKISNITSTNQMFLGMTNLNSVNISNLNTSNVTDMSEMFYGCENLSYIDMRTASFDKVTEYTDMFNFNNSQLETKIIVKDEEGDFTKTWIEDKVNSSKTTVSTVSEL